MHVRSDTKSKGKKRKMDGLHDFMRPKVFDIPELSQE